MIKFTDAHGPRLARLAPALMRPVLADQLLDHAHSIAGGAIDSIRDGSISGAGHIASLPGEPPNADTHDLDEHIHVGDLVETPDEIKTSVISDSDHAAVMELGGANVTERPYIRPQVDQQRGSTIRGLAGAFNRQVRG